MAFVCIPKFLISLAFLQFATGYVFTSLTDQALVKNMVKTRFIIAIDDDLYARFVPEYIKSVLEEDIPPLDVRESGKWDVYLVTTEILWKVYTLTFFASVMRVYWVM